MSSITFYPDFDAFPMFTSDGKRLVWASNRNGKVAARDEYFHRRLGGIARRKSVKQIPHFVRDDTQLPVPIFL